MVITKSQLLRAIPELYKPRLDEFVASFNQWATTFEITTPLRVAMYMAQVFHESGSLRYVEELASGAAYDTGPKAKALGNTPEKDGDGQLFKGRGFIQLTGRANYEAFNNSDVCTEDVMANPKLVAKFPLNQVASMWFWEKNHLNQCADDGDIEKATRIINGGMNGLSNRKFLYRRFLKEFCR